MNETESERYEKRFDERFGGPVDYSRPDWKEYSNSDEFKIRYLTYIIERNCFRWRELKYIVGESDPKLHKMQNIEPRVWKTAFEEYAEKVCVLNNHGAFMWSGTPRDFLVLWNACRGEESGFARLLHIRESLEKLEKLGLKPGDRCMNVYLDDRKGKNEINADEVYVFLDEAGHLKYEVFEPTEFDCRYKPTLLYFPDALLSLEKWKAIKESLEPGTIVHTRAGAEDYAV